MLHRLYPDGPGMDCPERAVDTHLLLGHGTAPHGDTTACEEAQRLVPVCLHHGLELAHHLCPLRLQPPVLGLQLLDLFLLLGEPARQEREANRFT